MSLPNPYTPGELPRVLAGRDAQRALVRERLDRAETFGELAGRLLVFHAPRGIGKTSLLRAGQDEADERGFVSAWVSCSREASFLADLVVTVDAAFDRADVTERGRWSARLSKVGVELGVPGAKVSAELDVAGPERDRPAGARVADLEGVLRDAAGTVRDRGGAGLAVFVDEVHAAATDDLATLLNALQNLAGDRSPTPLAVVAAGLPSSPERLIRAATFAERHQYVALDRLDEAAAELAVAGPAHALDVRWATTALHRVTAQAAGYPFVLQIAGDQVWRAVGPSAGDTIGADAVRRARPAVDAELETLFSTRYNSASPLEQDLLAAMARVGGPGDPPVRRGDVAAAMGRDSRAISVPRGRLIDKGIIEPVVHGKLRFTLPQFGDYVRRRTG